MQVAPISRPIEEQRTHVGSIADSELEQTAPQSEKIAALRQTYFADVDALEKSGEVKLPT